MTSGLASQALTSTWRWLNRPGMVFLSAMEEALARRPSSLTLCGSGRPGGPLATLAQFWRLEVETPHDVGLPDL